MSNYVLVSFIIMLQMETCNMQKGQSSIKGSVKITSNVIYSLQIAL